MSQCATCGIASTTLYCPACGERRLDHHSLSLSHFFEHALEAFLHFDSSIVRSIRTLIFDPGRLTADWSAGKRKPYLAPVQFLLVINVFYFLVHIVSPWNTLTTDLNTHMTWSSHQEMARSMVEAKLSKSGGSLDDFRKRFDAKAEILAKSLVIVMAPLFAVAVALLHIRSRRYFVEHLVFSLHFYAFLLSYFCVAGPVTDGVLGVMAKLGQRPGAMAVDGAVSLIAGAVVVAYLSKALKTVYRQHWALAAAKGFALTVCVLWVLQAYRFILFLITYSSVRA